jgi:hypothetical protein
MRYEDQCVLILNQNATPCNAVKYGSLLALFQESLDINCIQEQSANCALDNRLKAAPDEKSYLPTSLSEPYGSDQLTGWGVSR